MLNVPLAAVPSQTLSVVLDGQSCQISVYQKRGKLFFDLAVNGAPITTTAICRDRGRLLMDRRYLGFVGDFMFIDTQGVSDPTSRGLQTRYQLIYLQAADLA